MRAYTPAAGRLVRRAGTLLLAWAAATWSAGPLEARQQADTLAGLDAEAVEVEGLGRFERARDGQGAAAWR